MAIIYFTLYKCDKCDITYQLNSPEVPPHTIKCVTRGCDGTMHRLSRKNT